MARVKPAPSTASSSSGDGGLTVEENSGGALSTTDLDKLLRKTGAGSSTYTLPIVTVANAGSRIRIQKEGAGTVTVTPPAGVKIGDGANAQSVRNSTSETYVFIEFTVLTATQWGLGPVVGTWAHI